MGGVVVGGWLMMAVGEGECRRGAKFPGEGCADHDKLLFPPRQKGKSATDRALPANKIKKPHKYSG